MSGLRIATVVACIALVVTSTAPALASGTPSAGRRAASTHTRPAGIQATATVHRSRSTGMVRYIGGAGGAGHAGDPVAVTRQTLGGPVTARATADAFVRRYGAAFGARRPARDLAWTRTTRDTTGGSIVDYRQLHGGIPVLGGGMIVHVSRRGDVVAAFGELAPDLDVGTTPRLSASTARAIAAGLTARTTGTSRAGLSARTTGLRVVDPRIIGGRGLPIARLAWRVEVTSAARGIDDETYVDAATGAVLVRFDHAQGIEPVIHVCDAANTQSKLPCTSGSWVAKPAPTSDAGRAVTFSRDTWSFLWTTLGRLSLDGSNAPMVSTVRFCFTGDCPMQNAFWYRGQVTFGKGYAGADDVVAHEFMHGVVEREADLFPWYQTGAIGESISDLFGELVDQSNSYDRAIGSAAGWKVGEDLPTGPIRDMRDPTTFGDPDRMTSGLYDADLKERDMGGVHANSGVGNKAAYLMVEGTGGGSFNGQTITGIGSTDTAAIWYQAITSYLLSGSDYADLADALTQSCRWLVGYPGTDDVTEADCDEVAKAIAAVEMRKAPTVAKTQIRRARECPDGRTAASWVFPPGGGSLYPEWSPKIVSGKTRVWYASAPEGWTYGKDLQGNAWGEDYGRYAAGSSRNITDSALMSSPWLGYLPANAYLYVRHAYSFDDGTYKGRYLRFDGGVVEYDLTPATPDGWRDLAPFVLDNGYNGTITRGWGNPLATRKAFTAESNGLEETRWDLSSFADDLGIRFRFRLGTDNSLGDLGWFIDRADVYTCGLDGDWTGPAVTAPVVRLAAGVVTTNGFPVHGSFTAVDAEDTVASTSIGSGLGWFQKASATATEAAGWLLPGTASTWAIAIDSAHNTSSQAYAPEQTLTAHESSADGIVFSGAWTDRAATGFHDGTARSATSAAASATLTFTGTDVSFLTTLGPDRGRVRVFVDDVEVPGSPFDLAAPAVRYGQVVVARHVTGDGAHTIRIQPAGSHSSGSSGDRVDVDAIVTLAGVAP